MCVIVAPHTCPAYFAHPAPRLPHYFVSSSYVGPAVSATVNPTGSTVYKVRDGSSTLRMC